MSFVKLDEAHRPDSSAVFLDTSIHCCFLKGQILAPRLKSLLKLFNWKGSSTYSKTEYGNVILANAQYYLRKLREFQSVGTLLEHISHVLPPLHREKRTWAFTLIISLGKTEKIRTRRTDASLRRLLKIGTKVIEFHCDSPLANGTNCHWGNTVSSTNAMENTCGNRRIANGPIGHVVLTIFSQIILIFLKK